MYLLDAGLAKVQGRLELGARAQALADQVPRGADRVVVERMFHYPTHGRQDSRQRQDRVANDLLDLQAIGGIVAGHVVAPGGSIEYVTAHGWKGETPKDVTARRIMGPERPILLPEELEILRRILAAIPKGLHHNVLDALGIGLWKLRRWKR